mgnify:CR=1 FL=1
MRRAAKIIPASVRLTVTQYLTLRRKARKARMTMSEYVVRAVFRMETVPGKYWRKGTDSNANDTHDR